MSEIQYWINQNGVQAGPVTREELENMSLTDTAYVWRAGMAEWVRITEMSELQGCYQASTQPSDAPESFDGPESAEDSEFPESFDSSDAAEPVVPPIPTDMPPAAMPQYVPQPMPQQAQSTMPKCPPTNLVWAIIATILCCLPLGVVAIIYSVKVSQKYNEGDLAAAEHYSEVSAWWCIGTIVGGIILSPFVSLIQMAMMQ